MRTPQASGQSCGHAAFTTCFMVVRLYVCSAAHLSSPERKNGSDLKLSRRNLKTKAKSTKDTKSHEEISSCTLVSSVVHDFAQGVTSTRELPSPSPCSSLPSS